MSRIFSLSSVLIASLLLTACSPKPPESAFLNRGGPESLLDVSTETVNLKTGSKNDIHDLSAWIAKDQPTRAELHCTETEKFCKQARQVLELNGVPTVFEASADNTVTLQYQRVLAHDCKQAYIDNGTNDYNAPHPAFGCSIAANMVQQVPDKQEFISPNRMDKPSAARSVGIIRNANTPRPIVAPYSVGQSQTTTK